MDLPALGGLGLLALVDSTSFGTLGLPVLMLAQRRVATRPYLFYLAVICGFYALLGVGLLAGAGILTSWIGSAGEDPAVLRAQLAIGVLPFAVSFLVDKKGRAWLRRLRGRPEPVPGQGRHARWAARVTGPGADLRVVGVVALAAGLIEAASMVPYLGAIGIISAARPPWSVALAVLGAYVLVMAAPALLLLGGRLALADRLDRPLARVQSWIERNSEDTLGWILGIVGFVVAADAANRLMAVGLLG